jgi:phosphoribosylaminoimidazole carboxylase (NCAIR synthetase)
MTMRLRAPIPFLPTLFILIKTRIIQFSQHVKAILGLSIYSYHLPTVTKSGGMIGGMKLPIYIEILSNSNQRL